MFNRQILQYYRSFITYKVVRFRPEWFDELKINNHQQLMLSKKIPQQKSYQDKKMIQKNKKQKKFQNAFKARFETFLILFFIIITFIGLVLYESSYKTHSPLKTDKQFSPSHQSLSTIKQTPNKIPQQSFSIRSLIKLNSRLLDSQNLKQNKNSLNKTLPFQKIIWIYYQNINQNQNQDYMKFFINSWFLNINPKQYQVLVLSKQNLKEFLQTQQITFIENIAKNDNADHNQKKSNKSKNPKLIQSYIKLCILSRYGGIFLDSSIVFTQPLEWLQSLIIKNSNSQILNKWGQQPEVFMFHLNKSLQDNNQFKDKKYVFNNFYKTGVKEAWNLEYQVGFIASVKGSKLAIQWKQQLERYQLNIRKKLNQNKGKQSLDQKYDCQSFYLNKTDNNIFSNSLICLLHRKQKQLNQNAFNLDLDLDFMSAARFFKIWSCNLNDDLTSIQQIIDDSTDGWSFNKDEKQIDYRLQNSKFLTFGDLQINLKLSKDQNIYRKVKNALITRSQDRQKFHNYYETYNVFEDLKATQQQYLKIIRQEQKKKQQQRKKKQQQQKQLKFEFPKKIWLFTSSDLTTHRYLTQLNIQAIHKYASLNNYQVFYVNQKTYSQYLTNASLQKIKKVNDSINEHNLNKKLKVQKSINGNQIPEEIYTWKYVFDHLLKYLVLYENGGMVIDYEMTVLEGFEWVENIMSNINLNYGNIKDIKPQYFSFHHTIYGSFPEKQLIQRQYQPQKQIILFPSIQNQFIVGIKQGKLMKEIIQQYIDLIINQYSSKGYKNIDKSQHLIGYAFQNKNIYQSGHRLAHHIVLQRKQEQLDKLNQLQKQNKKSQSLSGSTKQQAENKNQTRKLAIDYYGLVTLNIYLGPLKFYKYFSLVDNSKYISHLNDLSTKQLQYEIGELKYMVKVIRKDFLQEMLQYAYKPVINRDSFLNQQFLKHENEEFIKKRNFTFYQEKTVIDPQANQWSIEKNIFIIWDSGIDKSSTLVQACHRNLKKSAQKSGFTLNVISKSNLKQFISKELLKKIDHTVMNADYRVSRQAVADLWRLALLYEHGGVYLDASTFQMQQSFDWLKYITRLPSDLIWNRFSSQPDVLMFFNSFYGGKFQWKYNAQYNTKQQWLFAYQNNFIAAKKNSKLIKDMIEAFIQFIILPYQSVKQLMDQNYINGYMWINKYNRYLTAMDSIKYVFGSKQKQLWINKSVQYVNSNHYYNAWTMNGFGIGQQKIRGNQNNYYYEDFRYSKEEVDLDNPFKFKYSKKYSQSIIGKVKYQTKFFSNDLNVMNIRLNQIYKNDPQKFNTSQYIHPESILQTRLQVSQLKDTVEYYSKLTQIKLKYKGVNKVWYC